MKLEDQVCSLELAKELKALGVKQESAFYWIGHYVNTTDCVEKPETARLQLGTYGTEYMWKYAAFTVAELGEMLPKDIGLEFELSQEDGWTISAYDLNGGSSYFISDEKEADARAKMLIHLIEKGIVKP